QASPRDTKRPAEPARQRFAIRQPPVRFRMGGGFAPKLAFRADQFGANLGEYALVLLFERDASLPLARQRVDVRDQFAQPIFGDLARVELVPRQLPLAPGGSRELVPQRQPTIVEKRKRR